VGASVEDLLTENVGMTGVLRELTKHLQLQGPHQAVATTVDSVIGVSAAITCRDRSHRRRWAAWTEAIVSAFVGVKERSGVVGMPISA
jgi:hypothetical protein